MAGVAFPAAVVCALLGAAVLLVGTASAAWHAQVFVVGGEPRGWAKPEAPNEETYNHWAARNRFHVGDFLHFKYDKNDSVLVVSGDDYKFCGAAKPALRFDGGDTRFRLDHSGFCYFISGAPGHCDAGQRMTVRVLPQQQEGSSRPAPAEAPAAMPPVGGGEDEGGGSFGPPFGSGSGAGGGSTPGHGGGASGSGSGSGSTSSSTTPPPRGVVGADGNNRTSGAASALAPSTFGGCCHVVGAVLLFLAA
ncbi:hypothetical protein BAE44_0025912 [Dichanthelium oligosanthes]|uniref:Phytocyanin domain-containing protein n=1 Tax=Dichanthelium oligosanthes TaxID=888268 RepID=A0A1E5UJL0_9POAL|nr:hypothetical protein BAE44_0025912 [Dichanthelium oligosanthes]